MVEQTIVTVLEIGCGTVVMLFLIVMGMMCVTLIKDIFNGIRNGF